MLRVLHISPHPDDELLGCPATLFYLRDLGHKIDNLSCTLGSSKEEHSRRRAELEEACRRARFSLLFPSGDLESTLAEMIPHYDLVISPSPSDAHPRHRDVALSVGKAIGEKTWWQWSLWSELEDPVIITPFTEERMAEIIFCLEAHHGELLRNDYRKLLRGRALATSVLAPEKCFAFGSPGIGAEFAETVSERRWAREREMIGEPRILQADNIICQKWRKQTRQNTGSGSGD